MNVSRYLHSSRRFRTLRTDAPTLADRIEIDVPVKPLDPPTSSMPNCTCIGGFFRNCCAVRPPTAPPAGRVNSAFRYNLARGFKWGSCHVSVPAACVHLALGLVCSLQPLQINVHLFIAQIPVKRDKSEILATHEKATPDKKTAKCHVLWNLLQLGCDNDPHQRHALKRRVGR